MPKETYPEGIILWWAQRLFGGSSKASDYIVTDDFLQCRPQLMLKAISILYH